MIFASVKAGHYLVIEHDTVIAEVKRKLLSDGRNPKWTKQEYHLVWRSTGVTEIFQVLPQIHEFYAMENYPGYGKVLKTNG